MTIQMSPQAPEWLGQPARHPCVAKAAGCAVHTVPLHKILTLLCQVGRTYQEFTSEALFCFIQNFSDECEMHNAKLKGYVRTCKL